MTPGLRQPTRQMASAPARGAEAMSFGLAARGQAIGRRAVPQSASSRQGPHGWSLTMDQHYAEFRRLCWFIVWARRRPPYDAGASHSPRPGARGGAGPSGTTGRDKRNRAASRCRQAGRHREAAPFHGLVCTTLLGRRSARPIILKQQYVECRGLGQFIVRAEHRPYIPEGYVIVPPLVRRQEAEPSSA